MKEVEEKPGRPTSVKERKRLRKLESALKAATKRRAKSRAKCTTCKVMPPSERRPGHPHGDGRMVKGKWRGRRSGERIVGVPMPRRAFQEQQRAMARAAGDRRLQDLKEYRASQRPAHILVKETERKQLRRSKAEARAAARKMLPPTAGVSA